MTRCSVPLCSHNANHHFPKDIKQRHNWLKAIEREDFVPKNGARICRRHFHRSDYVQVSQVTGRPLVRRCLKKTAVPSVFPWNRKSVSKVNVTREERRKGHQTYKRFDKTRKHHKDDARNVSNNIESPMYNDVHSRPLKSSRIKHHTQGTQTLDCTRLFATTKQLLSDDESVLFYTGLDNYAKFTSLLSTLLPMANEIKYRSKKANTLTAEDQFLILLIKLKRSKPDFEIGKMFGVNKTDVSNVIVTWVSFVTDHWSHLDSWPNQHIVDSYMPQALRGNVSNRIVIDAEIPIKKENYSNAERASFSQYKLKKTVKLIAGCTRDGLVIHCLEPEASTASGVQIRDESPISGEMSVDHKLAKSISMEKLVGSTKTFKILASALNQNYAPLSSKIFSVCLMICSIRVGIVTVNNDLITY
ncbi:hypothetical protein PYW08_010771 [Mythimna loreyi]|uniref:Uncharacterized protein n=1 Tax=Mythimna loreyi TaxID=667449 RepID=A0ACC2Q5V8_9NEOP|nr:hypothetical protein PYW08_010771 [Mythimna loreyi]